jgi:hypothetical protein
MYDQVALSLSLIVLGAIIAGILQRRRYRSCWMFVVYLVAIAVTDLLPTIWPERFFTGSFWLVRESLHNIARFGVALELAYWTFRAFPGARSTARALLLLLVATSFAFVLAAAWDLPRLPEYSDILTQLQPALLRGTLWLLVGIACLILWYRLPVEPMHKGILVGLVPYLLIFSEGLDLAHRYGWEQVLPWLNVTLSPAYLLLLGYWARAAWGRVPAAAVGAAMTVATRPAA